MKRKCELLAAELQRLPVPELKAWDAQLTDFFYRAYSYDLWGAIVLIKGGCGDDSFMDFRFTLISLGRKIYERAMAEADSLADVDFKDPTFEGYQYVASRVYEERMRAQGRTQQQLDEEEERERAHMPRHPKGPAGKEINEWEMEARYPRLAAKHGHKDAHHEDAKKSAKKKAADRNRASELAELLLDSGIVPSCGKLPPLGVVAAILRTGKSPPASGRQFTWEPFELVEGDFWNMVMRIHRPTEDQLKRRPDLRGKEVRLDPNRVPDNDYDLWLKSLKERGLA